MNEENKQTLRENRKIISTIKKTIQKLKTNSYETIKTEIIKIFQESKKDITKIINDNNNTLAHIAVIEGNFPQLKIIIESYLEILGRNEDFYNFLMRKNDENLTIYDLSAQKGNKEIIKFLYEQISGVENQTIKLNNNKNNIFHNAAKKNQCYSIIFFFEKLQKLTPKTLILDIKNELGITPLHYACYYGNKNAMDLLLDLGANINSVDNNNLTPLHYAIKSGNEKIIKKLLVRGADKFIKSKDGLSCFDMAKELKNNDIIQFLEHKNCFFNLFGNNELKAIKGGRNNLMLIFIIICLIFGKIIYIFKPLPYITENIFKYELMPFIPDLINEIENENNQTEKIINVSNNGLNIFFTCFSKNCSIEICVIFISLFTDTLILIVVIYFLCFAKKVYLRKRSKREVRSLIKLFEEQKSVCVKCRINIKSGTMHCLVCNSCVEKWDHHCFWLNTCINEKNKKQFNIFFYSMMVFVFLNILFFLLNTYIWYNGKPILYEMLFNAKEGTFFYFICQIIFMFFNIFMFLFCFYSEFFILIPILNNSCSNQNDEGLTLSEYQAKLLMKTNNNESSLISNSYSIN